MNQNDANDDKIEQGFSSEEQFTPEQIVYTETLKEKPQTIAREEIKFIIPPAQEIKDKRYSLRPDIATGWQPKIQLPSPIPIIFESPRYDNIIKRLLKKPSPKTKVSYLGPRYQNTYYAWYNKTFSFPYNHIKKPHNIKFSDRQFCGQHWQADEDLQFDSIFESGNLDCAVKVGQCEYDLFMRVDSNTRGHLQWFNFRVKNMEANKEYQFNICNFQKAKILYGRGLKPYVFSTQRHLKQKISWQQRGQNMTYDKKVCKTLKILGIEQFSLLQKRSTKQCKLSFTLSTPYQNDELQVSYCIPYTYTQMSQYLHKKCKQMESNVFINQKESSKDILRMSKLCDSLGGLEVPLVIVHQSHKEKTESTTNGDEDMTVMKRCVIVCGRAHPGESNGSYMIEGFIDFICGDSKQAEFLRKHAIFKIVPMINPDGVALGNYRTGLSGKDFNRQYKDPDKQVFPQVYAFKKLVTQNKFIFKQNMSIFLDFHGHSVKKNTFTYGPQFPIVNKFYYESRILPKLIGNLTPMFRYYSCSFKVAQCKNTTARAVVLKKLGVPLSYTIETSNGFYFDYEKLKDVAYTDAKWKQMGEKVGQGLYEYMQLVVRSDVLRHEKNKARKLVKKDIIIRKTTGRSVSHNKHPTTIKNDTPHTYTPHSMILEGIQDQSIKLLFQQIKKAQQQKQLLLQQQHCSDDQLSQGSSDGEDVTDDLSAKQFSKLFTCIKNKRYKNLDKCKLSPGKRTMTDDLVDEEDQENGSKRKKTLHPSGPSQENIAKCHTSRHQHKKEFLFNLIETKKRSNTPKVVNFSFGLHHTPQKHIQQKSNVLPTKITFFDVSSHGKQDHWKHEAMHHRFTDMVHRKTFHSGNKQAKDRQKDSGNSGRVNIFTTTTYVAKHNNTPSHPHKDMLELPVGEMPMTFQTHNRRNSRFESHRHKKMAIENLQCS